MLLSAVSVLLVAQSSSEIPEGLMNNPVYYIVLEGRNVSKGQYFLNTVFTRIWWNFLIHIRVSVKIMCIMFENIHMSLIF